MKCPIWCASIFGGKLPTFVKYLTFPSTYQQRYNFQNMEGQEMSIYRNIKTIEDIKTCEENGKREGSLREMKNGKGSRKGGEVSC